MSEKQMILQIQF